MELEKQMLKQERARGADSELWTSESARAADLHTIQTLGVPSPVLMERAALCVSKVAERMLSSKRMGRIIVFCGPGNNGGDGYAVARQLCHRGYSLCAVQVGSKIGDETKTQQDIADAFGVEIVLQEQSSSDNDWSDVRLVIDALLGTGSQGAPRGEIAQAIRRIDDAKRSGIPILAVDLPSGVHPDTGQLAFDEEEGRPLAVHADATVTIQRAKAGLVITPGKNFAGSIQVADIGIVPASSVQGRDGFAWALCADEICRGRQALIAAEHKGMRGHVGVWGGSSRTPGAAILACRGAFRCGAGLVSLLVDESTTQGKSIAPLAMPELMFARRGDIERFDALVCGPGLSVGDSFGKLLEIYSESSKPSVWDAGALDFVQPQSTKADRVLTPHPGEAARLLNRIANVGDWTSARVQECRLEAAKLLASSFKQVIVLKGAGTIIVDGREPGERALPSKSRTAVCSLGGPALSVGGTGDVLAGMIGALLARGNDAFQAACLGVGLHALAGEQSTTGSLASEIADKVHKLITSASISSPNFLEVLDG